MDRARKLRVLISIPTFWQKYYFLPTIHYLLKDHCDALPELRESIEWLPPIDSRATPEELFAPYVDQTIDVLGLSCYEWNWELQMKLAELFKARNPRGLVVVGGPQADYKSKDFFERHPHVDLVVPLEGEGPFRAILQTLASGAPGFDAIAGVVSRSRRELDSRAARGEFLKSFERSPFIRYRDSILPELRALGPSHKKMAIWETTRGCPYGCTFCDWGSATLSQLRQFPTDRLREEIEFFAQAKFEVLFIADANFGILARDVELARELAAVKERTGYPQFVIYLTAKVNAENNLAIAEIFHKAKMTSSVVISLQHTDKDVLGVVRRTNMPDAKLKRHLADLEERNIPFMPQMILGIPGDTYQKWTKCLSDLLDLGMHEEIRSQNFSLLTNSPANEPEYRERWKIETVERYTICGTERRRKLESPFELTRSTYIVSSATYSKDDWVEMHMYDTLVKALHSSGMTRLLAVFLKKTHAISYQEFYERVKTEIFEREGTRWSKPFDRLREHRRKFLTDADAVEEIAIDDLKTSDLLYTTEEWLTYYVSLGHSELLLEIREILGKFYPQTNDDLLSDLLRFQELVYIDPEYDWRRGKRAFIRFAWPIYFKEALRSGSPEFLPAPAEMRGARELHLQDQRVGLNGEHSLVWPEAREGQNELRRHDWFHTIMGPVHLRSKRTLLQFS